MLPRITDNRFSLISLVIVAIFPLLIYQIVRLTIQDHDFLVGRARRQHNLEIELAPDRGAILDRNLKELATNLKVPSIAANPRAMTAQERARLVERLPGLLNLPSTFLRQRLHRDKSFVWLKRHASAEEAKQIEAMKSEHLHIQYEPKRFYPNGSILSNVLGFCNIDHQGVEGLELLYDDMLKGQAGYRRTKRDGRQREVVALEEKLVPAVNGADLILTVDQYIQFVTGEALDRAFKKWQAKGAVAVVMNPKTGEILAMSSRPTFNPNALDVSDVEARRNRAVTDMFEPGSVFKIVTVSAALNENRVTLEDEFYCEKGEWRVLGSRVIHDIHSFGHLSVPDILVKSSNIGTVKVAQRLGEQKLYEYMKRFGFGEETGIDFPGESEGILHPVGKWSKYSITSIPYGQEVASTAIQMLRAISVIANGGYLVQPYLVQEIRDPRGVALFQRRPQVSTSVLRPEVAQTVGLILERVVEEGTGKKAQIAGVRVAGKTGTSQKLDQGGQYSHEHFVGSFIGYAPVEDPRLAMIVSIDDPKPLYYGGTIAAPVFAEVMERSLLHLGHVPEQKGEANVRQVLIRVSGSEPVVPKNPQPEFRGATPQVR